MTSACSPGAVAPAAPPAPAPLAERYAIVPQPRRLTPAAGELTLGRETRIVVSDTSLRALAELFAESIRRASGLPLTVEATPSADTADAIVVALDPGAAPAEPEGYRLVVGARGARVSASTVAGLFYGLQTLRQLLPAAAERDLRALDGWPADSTAPAPASAPARWTIPAVEVEDAPRFRYRGILLDVARYYYRPEFIRELVDLLALYKYNTLQLHLTDDQGWRLEIRKYPRLTQVGAWRKETVVAKHFDPYLGDGKPHGGFYTQAEMRALVAYAAARHVTIIPEIEMPGHTGAAIAAYPTLACTNGPFEVSTVWNVHDDIFCPSEMTFAFVEDVLDEVMSVFPSEYIHIGGDEAPKTRWKASPAAQELMHREGLKNEEELQSYFTRRVERYLRAHGRKLIGWDEILEGGIAPQATVMSWRGMEGGIAAARQGHDVIMSPGDYAYLDHYQGDPAQEPLAIGDYLPLDTVYAFEPVPHDLTPAEGAHILGPQGNLWTEYIATPSYAEYMLFPRMLALSEVAWSTKEARSWTGFLARLPAQLSRLDALGVDYRVPEPMGQWGDRKVLEGKTRVTIASPVAGGVVRYTTDGTNPTASSPVYTAPVELRVGRPPAAATVSARLFLPNGRTSVVARTRIMRTTWKPALGVRAESVQPELAYAYVEGKFTAADELRTASPTRAGLVAEVELRGDERPEQYGIRMSGVIRVPQDALYTFYLVSDDGAKLRIDDEVLVDHDGEHGPTEKQGQAALRAGYHRFELVFFQAGGGADLQLTVSAPGIAKRVVPAEWLGHTASAQR